MHEHLHYLSRGDLINCAPPAPAEAIAHGEGSDVDGDLEVLWALATLVMPQRAVELGTRHGASTRTLSHALNGKGLPPLWTVDPDPACREHLALITPPHYVFLCKTGEEAFASKTVTKMLPTVDLLFVDTDPHTYDQTKVWLDTWVTRVRPGGCVAFHDIVAARPEIQVADAVRDFVTSNRLDVGVGRLFNDGRQDRESDAWIWREYPSPRGGYGIGVLWAL